MKLSIVERLLLLEMLPKQGDFAALKELRQAKEVVSFTGAELVEHEIVNDNGRVSWKVESDEYEIDIPLSAWITSQIQDQLRKLNDEKKLQDNHFTLYEKFIVSYDQV